ncbi:MAG: prolipoprotein diacylglyceryl transferase [Candidatus Nephrothrix sp. EaCA]|nr:MAG: prolipoprotein diacylglyceryl transferase [Candidatus Nephrothrix sp. EaCA]
MHPVLFSAGPFTIYTYGFFISFGALLCLWYLYRQSKMRYNLTYEQIHNIFLIIIVASVAGGKLFMIFESPKYYFDDPRRLFSRSGFVFFGALLACIPAMLWYFKKIKAPLLGMLDIMAGVACIVHGVGRFGCFFAGCCHGSRADVPWAVTFTDPQCSARPLGVPLHPTQFYEIAWIALVFAVILLAQQKKKFDGQLFLLYLILYSIGRSFIEIYRGDEERGFIFGAVSNSQFISALVVAASVYFFIKLGKKGFIAKGINSPR